MKLIADLDKEIKDKNFTKLVSRLLKAEGQKNGHTHQVYFTYFKRMYNLKRMEENSLLPGRNRESIDALVKRKLGHFPPRCYHLKTAFFAWRSIQ